LAFFRADGLLVHGKRKCPFVGQKQGFMKVAKTKPKDNSSVREKVALRKRALTDLAALGVDRPVVLESHGGTENVNLKDVERGTGLPYATVYAWWARRVTRADFPVLIKWCKYLGCQVGDLLVYQQGG
jgi:DNA-binding Xre family transcriptional regulator